MHTALPRRDCNEHPKQQPDLAAGDARERNGGQHADDHRAGDDQPGVAAAPGAGQRLDPGPTGQDLEGRDALRGRVAVPRRGDVGTAAAAPRPSSRTRTDARPPPTSCRYPCRIGTCLNTCVRQPSPLTRNLRSISKAMCDVSGKIFQGRSNSAIDSTCAVCGNMSSTPARRNR